MKKKTYIFLIVMFWGLTLSAQSQIEKLETFDSSIKSEAEYNFQAAIDELLKIKKDYHDDYLLNLRLGWLYYNIRDYKQSLNYYNRAVKLSDNSIESLLGITLPYSALSNWEAVEDIYKKVLDVNPHNKTANINLGKIYFSNKDYLNAKIYFEQLNSDYPSDYSGNLYLGWTYYYLGSLSKAREFFVNALIASPDDTSAKEGIKLTS